jgi:vanillate monooxygenase ferredoxin subunit
MIIVIDSPERFEGVPVITVTVTQKTLEAEETYSYELARTDGTPLPAFSAGAHIDVHGPNGHVRQYSLCNDAGETARYRIAVLKEPASRGGSAAMADLVAQGDTLQISAPRLLFPLQADNSPSLLFAGGIGITPILSMASCLASQDREFSLHYCARSASRMAFREQILGSAFARRAQLHFDDGAAEQRLDIGAVLAAAAPGTHLYVCGPGGFMEHIIQAARTAGWPEARIHREYFAAPETGSAENGVFDIKIASTGQILTVPAGVSAVEMLNGAGYDIPVSCEQGVCGTCLCKVLEGEPEHRDLFLTDAEHARNDQFTPCCSRARSPMLVLDL